MGPQRVKKMNKLACSPKILIASLLMALGGFGAYAGSAQVASQAQAPAGHGNAKPGSGAAEANSTYLRDVLPIFAGKCARCHNQQSALPNWLDYKTAFGDRKEIRRRIWDSWKGNYYKQAMPAGNSPESQALSDEERTLIREWVDSGATCGAPAAEGNPTSKPERMEKGKRLFAVVCSACHQATGQGIPEKFPPLAGSDFLNADKNRAIKILLHGRQGEITVNGQKFNNSMPSLPFGDEDIASALTYVYNSFGNSGKEVTAAEVKAMRSQKDDLTTEPAVVAHSESGPSPFE